VTALDTRHRVQQERLAHGVARRLGGMLRGLPDLAQPSVVAYHDGALVLVLGGQHTSANLAAGYTAARSRRRLLDVDVVNALARSGVLVTTDSRSLVAPVLRARHLVAEGAELAAALENAAGYAAALSSNDLQAAQRVGLAEGAGDGVVGWRKLVGPDACQWCNLTADTVYADPDSIPFHDNDRCSVEPVLENEPEPVFTDEDIPF
jgi:hypothetical protein